MFFIILKFVLLKLQIRSLKKQSKVIYALFAQNQNKNDFLFRINSLFGDKYQFSNDNCKSQNENASLIAIVRLLKHCNLCCLPQFALQTFVFIFYEYSNNQFRLTQYAISSISSLFMFIHSFLWLVRHRIQ